MLIEVDTSKEGAWSKLLLVLLVFFFSFLLSSQAMPFIWILASPGIPQHPDLPFSPLPGYLVK
jgi:hypothetical protein